MFVYGNHLSGVIIFLRTTEARSCRGLLQFYCEEGGNSSFLSSKRFFLGGKTIDTTRQIIDIEKLIQYIAVTSLTAVKIEERNEKSNSIRRHENAWQHRLISWVYPASSLVCCTLLLLPHINCTCLMTMKKQKQMIPLSFHDF